MHTAKMMPARGGVSANERHVRGSKALAVAASPAASPGPAWIGFSVLERERDRDRETERQRQKDRDRQTDRDRETRRERQRD